MYKGGYVSDKALESTIEKLKERPSWWLLDGKLVHCTSWELQFLREINKMNG